MSLNTVAEFAKELHKSPQDLLEQLRAAGVTWPENDGEEASATKGVLAGQIFVLTGTLPTLSRDDAKALIEAAFDVK